MYSYHIWTVWFNVSYTVIAEPIRALEWHYPMIQFLIVILINTDCSSKTEIDYILLYLENESNVMQNENINTHIHCIYLLSLCMFLDFTIHLNFYL